MKNKRKPNGYWTKERCHEEALLCNSKSEFEKRCKSAYTKSLTEKWIDDICQHMNKKIEYTIDYCIKKSETYTYKIDFIKNEPNLYRICVKNDWVDIVCKYMLLKQNKKNYWTFEKCKEEALKYENKTDFQKYGKGSYTVTLKNNWLSDICCHMLEKQKPNGYFSFEKCKELALKYKTKTDFYNNDSSAYSKSLSKGWIKEICSHMEEKGNLYNRCIYVYEFPDNHAYVGLTYNINKRNKEHFERGPVYKHFSKTNYEPILKKLTDYILINDAILKEEYYFQEYKNSGWTMLNILKTGGVGGGKTKKYTDDFCHMDALKYETKVDFKNNSTKIYNVAKKRKIIDMICSHMKKPKIKPSGYWTFENCELESKKYKTKKEFKLNAGGCYQQSMTNKWLDKICVHMIKKSE